MTLPTYDWLFLSDTREMVAKERTDITGAGAAGASIVIALVTIVILVALLYML